MAAAGGREVSDVNAGHEPVRNERLVEVGAAWSSGLPCCSACRAPGAGARTSR
jgi:hypothetical protein